MQPAVCAVQSAEMLRRAHAALFVVLAAVLILILVRASGPRPKPADAPASDFSAVRAMDALKQTVGTLPHPLGSEEHEKARARIAAHLESLGYEVQIQSAFVCSPHATCAPVVNLIARQPGQLAGPAVLLAAHYDSVPAGPGAADDGSGVATLLEIARIARTERFRNRIVFLIDDGEEVGLLGAEAFTADPNLSKPVAAVINLEARGTAGPSFLFETSRNNRWMVDIASRKLPRPITTSLFPAIYDLLPNDTDLTVFKRAGLQGVNFAFLRNVTYYHTPFDDVQHLDLGTLQHHGENALAMTRGFGNTPLPQASIQSAVWFDVAGFFVVRWPEHWTLALAILSALIGLIAAALLLREASARIGSIAIGAAAMLGTLAIAAVAGVGFTWLLGLRGAGIRWVAHPGGAIAAMWALGIGTAIVIGAATRRRISFDSQLVAAALVWNALGVIVTLVLPGGSYLLIIPALILSIGALLRAFGAVNEALPAIAGGVVAGLLYFPLALQLYDALGTPVLPGIALLLALFASTFMALFEPPVRRLGLSVTVVVLLCVVAALVMPPTSAEVPRQAVITYLDDGGKAVWIADEASPELQRITPFRRTTTTLFPWSGRSSYLAAAAPRFPIAPVDAEVTAQIVHDGLRTMTVHVRSPRGAARISLTVQGEVTAVRVNGVVPPPRPVRFHPQMPPGWSRIAVRGSEATIELTVRGTAPVAAWAMDVSSGLPDARLSKARDASQAIPVQEGDLTITMKKL
jgi:hypothetical protein